TDISSQRSTEAALREALERLDAAQRLAGIGTWEIDTSTMTVKASDVLNHILELGPEESFPLFDESATSFIHPDDRVTMRALVRGSTVSGRPFAVEVRVRRRGAEWRRLAIHGRVERKDEGRPSRVWGTAQDVTPLRDAQKALLEAERELFREHVL